MPTAMASGQQPDAPTPRTQGLSQCGDQGRLASSTGDEVANDHDHRPARGSRVHGLVECDPTPLPSSDQADHPTERAQELSQQSGEHPGFGIEPEPLQLTLQPRAPGGRRGP
jgi:hypothetical protein